MKKLIVILAVIAMVGAFVAPALADVSLYGSARFFTYSEDVDKEAQVAAEARKLVTNVLRGDYATVDEFLAAIKISEYDTKNDDRDTLWRFGNLSRFGATFKSDKIGGRFEMDARVNEPIEKTDGGTAVGTMRLRLLYGTWDFGAGQLLIGQNYPLYNFAISGINYTTGGLQPYGGVAYATPRVSQMRLTFGNLKIAFLTPDTSEGGLLSLGKATDHVSDVDTMLPKVEVEYDLKLDPVAFQFVGGWQSYDIVDADDKDEDITSYVLAASAKTNFGPAYFNAALSYRVNGANYGVWTSVWEKAVLVDGVDDAETFGAVGALGFKVNDMLTIEGSIGYLKSELDTRGTWEDTNLAYGLLAKITAAPGVYIIPEFLVIDGDDITLDGKDFDEGKKTALGVFWRIDFK